MLPSKVREQAERAEALQREIIGNTAPPAAPAEPAPSPEPSVPAPVAVAPVAPPADPVAAPAPIVQDDPWEKKYRVLEGKYRAEVPALAAQVRELKETISGLEERLAAPAPAAPQPPAIDIEGMTPEQVVEQFGEDFAKAVGAVAASIAARNADSLRAEFKPQLESVQKATVESARTDFMRELTRLVPDWQAIDTDDNFTTFLDEVDELSGRSRRSFFNEADKRNDAARISRFFLAFKGNSAPASAPAPSGPSSIDAQLQPSPSRASAPVPPGKRYWTSADVRQFYVDVRKGRYSPQDTARIESDIFAAQRENRFAA